MPLFEDAGIMRDFFLILHCGVLFYSLLFGGILFLHWFRDKYKKIIDLRLAWSIFFWGLAVNTSFFIVSDFWLTEEPFNTTFVASGYIALMIAITAFFAAMEMILPYKTHHALTSIGIVSTFLPLFIPRLYFEVLALFDAFLALVGITLFLMYTWNSTAGGVRKNVQWVVIGFLIGWVGFIGRSDTAYNLGLQYYTIGLLMLSIGILMFGYTITTSPALDELDWNQQILELYVIQMGGLLMCHYQFVENPEVDQVLTAAGIAGIQSLFQEITRSDTGLDIVSIGEFAILFAHGAAFTSVLIAKKPYRILLDKVQEFTEKFEYEFGTVLRQFEGSLREFNTADELIQSVF